VRAQQPAIPTVGFLDNATFLPQYVVAFNQGLKEKGYIEGRTSSSNTTPPRVTKIGCPRSRLI
jgi:hypothetical protein